MPTSRRSSSLQAADRLPTGAGGGLSPECHISSGGIYMRTAASLKTPFSAIKASCRRVFVEAERREEGSRPSSGLILCLSDSTCKQWKKRKRMKALDECMQVEANNSFSKMCFSFSFRKCPSSLLLLLLLPNAAIRGSFAWSDEGHLLVATIAKLLLPPPLTQHLEFILSQWEGDFPGGRETVFFRIRRHQKLFFD
ncbi:hypothetical protein Efla_003338 [Eimeria flavescens]